MQGCFLHNQSCKASNHFQRSAKQSAGTQWVDKLPICSKVTGLTNRSFIIAKTISFSHTISARAPTAQSRRLSAPRSVQDEKRPFTAASSLCFLLLRCLKTPGKACFPEDAVSNLSCCWGPRGHKRVPRHMKKKNKDLVFQKLCLLETLYSFFFVLLSSFTKCEVSAASFAQNVHIASFIWKLLSPQKML